MHCTEGDIRDPHARRAVALVDRADLEDKHLKLMEENQVRPFCFETFPDLHTPSLITCATCKCMSVHRHNMEESSAVRYTAARINMMCVFAVTEEACKITGRKNEEVSYNL